MAHLTPYDAAYRNALAASTALAQSNGSSAADVAVQAHGMLYGTLLRQASMLSFADAFWPMGALFMLVVPLMFPMRKSGLATGALMME